MMNDTDLSRIRDIARQMLQNAAFSGLDHAERVRQIAEDIGQREGADPGVLRVAALLHDIGVPIDRERHYEVGFSHGGFSDSPSLECCWFASHYLGCLALPGSPDPGGWRRIWRSCRSRIGQQHPRERLPLFF